MIFDQDEKFYTESKRRGSFDLAQSFEECHPESQIDIDHFFEEDKVHDDFNNQLTEGNNELLEKID